MGLDFSGSNKVLDWELERATKRVKEYKRLIPSKSYLDIISEMPFHTDGSMIRKILSLRFKNS